MGLYYQAVVECDECGTVEESDPEYEPTDLPDTPEFGYMDHMCTEYECMTICSSCSENYSYCGYCEETTHIDNMFSCCGEMICSSCNDGWHDALYENSSEDEIGPADEFICEDCEYPNPDYNPTPAWVLA